MFARSGVYTLDIFGPEANSGDNVEVNTVKNIASAIASEDNVALETAFTEAVESGTRVGRSKIFPGEIYFNNEVEWGSVLGPVSMKGMFMGCLFGEQGEEGSNFGIDLSNMRTDKATNMAEMFEYTPMFTEVKVSQHFGTDMCKNMYAMFKFCGSLNATGKFGYGDSFTFPELTFKEGCIVESMFQGANIPVDLSKAKSPAVSNEVSALNAIKDYTRMFCDYGFYALTEIIGGQPKNLKLTLTDKDHPWTPPVGSTMEEMFRGCKADVDLSNLDVTNVVSFGGTFMSYGNTDQLDLFGFEPGTITWPTKG